MAWLLISVNNISRRQKLPGKPARLELDAIFARPNRAASLRSAIFSRHRGCSSLMLFIIVGVKKRGTVYPARVQIVPWGLELPGDRLPL